MGGAKWNSPVTKFSLSAVVERVLDRDFVPTRRYADLLLSRIPKSKWLPATLEVYGRRSAAAAEKIAPFFEAVVQGMKDEEVLGGHPKPASDGHLKTGQLE